MKFLKTLLILVCIYSSSYAQMENWYKADLSSIGYKYNNVKFEKRDATYANPGLTNTNIDYTDSSWIQFKGGSSEFFMDLYTKHVYFHFDFSIFTDLTLSLLTSSKKKETWWFKQDGVGSYSPGRFAPTRLGFGTNITKYFNLYAGGQWQYSFFVYEPEGNPPKYENSFIGGNLYGYGVHGALAIGPVLIRQSYMKDWIVRSGHYRGESLTYETAAYVGLANFGVFAKFNMQSLQMYDGNYSQSYTKHFKADLSGRERYYKAQKMTLTTFSIGIYASGILSGISTATSNAVLQTETGLRNERNQDKRNRIEWKE